MVAVVRGERGSTKPRSKTAAARGAPKTRARPSASYYAPANAASIHDGLGPRVAICVAIAVLAAGAIGAAALAHRGEAQPTPQPSILGRALAPLGFTLRHLQIQGAPTQAQAEILAAAGLTQGQPIVGLDLNGVRSRIEADSWVKEAKVVRLLPDTLVIAVIPRAPLAVWQHLGVARVVDTEGRVMDGADPGRFADLPLVVGDGAEQDAGVILPMLRARPKLMGLVDALIRVDGRRWDLRLKDGSLIQLPATGEDSALIELDQLDHKDRLLELGFERIDLRTPDTIAVRPKPVAPPGPIQQPAAVASPSKN